MLFCTFTHRVVAVSLQCYLCQNEQGRAFQKMHKNLSGDEIKFITYRLRLEFALELVEVRRNVTLIYTLPLSLLRVPQ
jgi:hypothetical protein